MIKLSLKIPKILLGISNIIKDYIMVETFKRSCPLTILQAKRLEEVKEMLNSAVTDEQFQIIISSIEDYIEKHPEEFQEK